MFQNYYAFIGDAFLGLRRQEKDCWIILSSSVAVQLLQELYSTFIKDGIDPIESLPTSKKTLFFRQSCRFHETKEQRIASSKAAYVLELISSTF